jgi:hypothetical protein
MYKLVCMSFDGDSVTGGEFDSINAVWERSNDMGSRWFFYPFHFAVTESGKSVAQAPDGLEHFNGKRLKTVRKAFETASKLPETQGVDCDIFALYL